MIGRLLPLLAAAALVLAGCGEEGDGGTASLWVTRDRGAEVLLTATVPAGLTAMQALDREADVETRYGGRFVESIEGLEGSLESRRDWFYFVNGLDADRSAAEYRLRDGDVEWWDYRPWQRPHEHSAVVGAFPEPFLHGYDGKRRRTIVQYDEPALESVARALGRRVRADRVVSGSGTPDPEANYLSILPGSPVFSAHAPKGAGGPVYFLVGAADAARLADDPELARYRYEGLP